MYKQPVTSALQEPPLVPVPRPLESIELFAGAGGLALGFSGNDVRHLAVIEWNTYACNTIRHSKLHQVEPISHWPDVMEGDVKHFKYDAFEGIDLITGGPPCQPLSMGGKHGGFLDERDMLPQAVRSVREAQLERPSLVAKQKEQWATT